MTKPLATIAALLCLAGCLDDTKQRGAPQGNQAEVNALMADPGPITPAMLAAIDKAVRYAPQEGETVPVLVAVITLQRAGVFPNIKHGPSVPCDPGRASDVVGYRYRAEFTGGPECNVWLSAPNTRRCTALS